MRDTVAELIRKLKMAGLDGDDGGTETDGGSMSPLKLYRITGRTILTKY